MSLIGFVFQIVLIYLVVKLVWGLLQPKGGRQRTEDRTGRTATKRFDAHGESISDAEFEEVKEE